MARILRGEIRWADLNPVRGHEQAGDRPVLVLSHDVFNERSGTVIAVALTSQEPRAGFPLTLELTAAKLPKRSWVKISQIRTLSTTRATASDSGARLKRSSPRCSKACSRSLRERLASDTLFMRTSDNAIGDDGRSPLLGLQPRPIAMFPPPTTEH